MRDHRYFVYVLASKPQGTLYVGVTNDLVRRVTEHRLGVVSGFTKRYDVKKLVWFEEHGDIYEAIAKEKRLKRWRREWKRSLVEKDNPHWADLYPALVGGGSRIGRSIAGAQDRRPG
ncbi:MAG: GIY-YIG nuclease family protein [Alphaproteobacteria bacterium]|nr:GIY-YIG nuclease family protein [Alphaproteobacteria bacterium]